MVNLSSFFYLHAEEGTRQCKWIFVEVVNIYGACWINFLEDTKGNSVKTQVRMIEGGEDCKLLRLTFDGKQLRQKKCY